MQRLAIISGALSDVYPNSRSVVVFSLNDADFDATKRMLKSTDESAQFKMDISGIEFIFIRESTMDAT
jgi:hypothetical protein